MSDVSGSWHPDPFGRFAQRYYDGTQWTEHVVDASGAQSTDPPVATPAPDTAPPPAQTYAPPTASYGAPPQQAYGQPAYGAPAATATAGPAISPGLIVAAVGTLLVLLGGFAFDWISADGDGASRGDLADAPGLDDVIGALSAGYVSWGYLLGIVAAALAIVACVNADLGRTLKLPAIIACAVVLAWHGQTMFNINDNLGEGESIGIGLILGGLGLVAALVGAVLGPKSTT